MEKKSFSTIRCRIITVNSVDRKNITTVIYGQGDNFVILHPGLGRDGQHYHELAKQLAQNTGWSVVLFDPRGHYVDCLTGEPENVYSFPGMTEDLNSLIRHFKNETNLVKIIGFSNGALVTAHVHDNQDVAGLCLVSCPISLTDGLAYGKMCKRYDRLFHKEMKKKFDRYFAGFCLRDSYVQEHRNLESAPFKIGKLYVKDFPQHVKNITSANTLNDLPEEITMPVTFIFAQYDFVLKKFFSKMPLVYQQVFKKFNNNNLTVAIVPKSTHGFGIKKERLCKQTMSLISELICFIKAVS